MYTVEIDYGAYEGNQVIGVSYTLQEAKGIAQLHIDSSYNKARDLIWYEDDRTLEEMREESTTAGSPFVPNKVWRGHRTGTEYVVTEWRK